MSRQNTRIPDDHVYDDDDDGDDDDDDGDGDCDGDDDDDDRGPSLSEAPSEYCSM